MVSTAPVTIITVTSPEYWARYGAGFVANIEALTVQPEEVIIVTEADVSVPDSWLVMPFWDSAIWPAVNEGVRKALSEWSMFLPIDDRLDCNFFDGLELSGDAVNVAGRWEGGLCYGTPSQYDRLLDLPHNGMPGLAIVRTDLFRRIPYRRIKFQDWAHWCELRANGCHVTFDRAVRWTWERHDDAFSAGVDEQAVRDVQEFCRLLKTDTVVPGEEWPPILRS